MSLESALLLVRSGGRIALENGRRAVVEERLGLLTIVVGTRPERFTDESALRKFSPNGNWLAE